MGFIGLKAFPAAVIGGFGSVPGAIAGGVIIGVVEALAGFYLPEGFRTSPRTSWCLAADGAAARAFFGGSGRKKV